jgi:hypothetical protein
VDAALMRRALLAAATVAALFAPAAQACDLASCVQNLPACDVVPDCQVCYRNEFQKWCIPDW